MAAAPLLAGVELGGTKCICILAAGPDDIRAEAEIPTALPHDTLRSIEQVLDEWRGFAALGIASFGPLRLDPGAADWGSIGTTSKRGWSGVALATRLSERFGVPLAIDTDVAGAALAEGRWGASRGLRSHAYVTIGTGIGIGLVIDGRPLHGLGHPEAGHMRVPRLAGDAWPGACPLHGDCVEGLASGGAIEARLGRSAGTLPPDDPIWPGVVHAIAAMLHNLVLTVAPERIVIGGGVPQRQPHLLPRIAAALVESLAGYGPGGRIADTIGTYLVPPALGPHAGPLGAIALAADARGGSVQPIGAPAIGTHAVRSRPMTEAKKGEPKKGDRVSWKSHGGTAHGKVVKKQTTETHIKGHKVDASSEKPQYIVETDGGARAAHKAGALKKS